MGLTKEVRNFFTGRINRLLNEKLQNVYAKIDKSAVREQAVVRLLNSVRVPPAVLKRYSEIEAERERLDAEKQEIKTLIYSAVEREFPKGGLYRFANNFVQEVEGFATKEYENKIIGEVYPEQLAEIEKLNRIKEDVEGVVLLSTTETKLVERLTEVLKKYGGDISELLEFIPK